MNSKPRISSSFMNSVALGSRLLATYWHSKTERSHDLLKSGTTAVSAFALPYSVHTEIGQPLPTLHRTSGQQHRSTTQSYVSKKITAAHSAQRKQYVRLRSSAYSVACVHASEAKGVADDHQPKQDMVRGKSRGRVGKKKTRKAHRMAERTPPPGWRVGGGHDGENGLKIILKNRRDRSPLIV